jgi:hypothetical protein
MPGPGEASAYPSNKVPFLWLFYASPMDPAAQASTSAGDKLIWALVSDANSEGPKGHRCWVTLSVLCSDRFLAGILLVPLRPDPGPNQERIELGRRLVLKTGQNMQVDTQSDVDLGATQTLLDSLGTDPLLEHETRGLMSQVVEPNVWQPGQSHNPLECREKVPRILWGASRGREDEIVHWPPAPPLT